MPANKIPLAAILLAGGKSRRMGRDKALLRFGEVTMLEHLARLAGRVFEDTLVVVERRSKTKGLDLGGAKICLDVFQNRGPLAGIYTGLSYASCEAACVLTCDMPFVDEVLLRSLAGFWRAGEDAVCFEEKGGRLQPFPGIYARSSRFLMRTLLDQGEASMKRFLEVALVRPLEFREERIEVFTNMNTIEDYYHVLKEKSGLVRE
jgi:molybdopterin-guanine dinucleotide biosynthesis protein A